MAGIYQLEGGSEPVHLVFIRYIGEIPGDNNPAPVQYCLQTIESVLTLSLTLSGYLCAQDDRELDPETKGQP